MTVTFPTLNTPKKGEYMELLQELELIMLTGAAILVWAILV